MSTFAFYETRLSAAQRGAAAEAAPLSVKSFEAMGLVAFVDGKMVGAAHEITHGDGAPKTLSLGPPDAGSDGRNGSMTSARQDDDESHDDDADDAGTLTILAEELGYANYGFTHQILKGLAPVADAGAYYLCVRV